MSRHLEVYVYVIAGDGMEDERLVEVTDYSYTPGRAARLHGEPEDCSPEEPAELMDVQCRWKDTQKELTSAEWEKHGERIEEQIWASIPTDQDLAEEAADHAYQVWKEGRVA